MKIFNKILKIIVIGAVIAIVMSACGTFGASKEMDEETLALKEKMDSASWEVKAMTKNTPLLGGFKSAEKIELTAFQNISIIKNMENHIWYALSAPEIPGTYYFYKKFSTGSALAGVQHRLFINTTIDAQTFASMIAFSSATWQVKTEAGQPSTAKLEKLDQHSGEATFFDNLLSSVSEGRYDNWYSFTAPEMPGIIYYYFERTPGLVSVGETKLIYKGGQ
ncbi:MAG: hypothetical protein FWC03_07530 [Treponema sp.]|nr:hypothetical protein [Treponema sp.]